MFVLEKYHAQMKEAQQVVAEKTSALEAEAYKTKRLHVSFVACSFVTFIRDGRVWRLLVL